MRDKRKNNNNSSKIERELSKLGNRRCLMMAASGKMTKGRRVEMKQITLP